MRAWLVSTLVAVVVLGACSAPSDESFRATDITGAEFARKLELTGHDGKPRTLSDFKGKVTVVFFGFTHCPDVCPTTLSKLAEVSKRLGADAERLQVLFVTVDPQRDTQEVLSRYVPAFDPRFLGLFGDAEATARTAKEFKIVYQKQAGKTPDSYTVDHSSGTFVFDPEGRVRLFVRHAQPVDDLVHDLRLLLGG
jgi:protein SCO1/2